MIALDLEDAMSALGFDICSLASTADTARSIAMDHQPDVVLMDVNLDGGREGSRPAGGFERYAMCPSYLSPHTLMRVPSSASMSRCQERLS